MDEKTAGRVHTSTSTSATVRGGDHLLGDSSRLILRVGGGDHLLGSFSTVTRVLYYRDSTWYPSEYIPCTILAVTAVDKAYTNNYVLHGCIV